LPERAISTEARHQLFLAIKEALNNVVRHSGATEVWLRMRCEANELQITIEDDGKGLPRIEPTGSHSGHDGLLNIRTRVEKLSGAVVFENSAEGGMRLIMKVPISMLHSSRITPPLN